MRNPLKRLARRDQPKVPLRARLDAAKQRLAAAKDKAGRIVAMNRIMLTKIQEPAPAVHRIALINYATWLHYERRQVCLELYPEAGPNAHRLVHSDVAADHFHFPPGRRWQDVPKPSTRAVATLDRLGIDWRRDRMGSGWADEKLSADACGKLPHGWPNADASLLEALDDLTRIDAAISTMHDAGSDDRDGDTVPGYDGLEEARNDTLARLARERAESLLGMQAKAKALLTRCLSDQGGEPYEAIAASLARDLLGARPNKIEPRPDPILALIEETRRLEAVCLDGEGAGFPNGNPTPGQRALGSAMWKHWREVVLTATPTTAQGCKALAAFASGLYVRWGCAMDDDATNLLGAIARSPLL